MNVTPKACSTNTVASNEVNEQRWRREVMHEQAREKSARSSAEGRRDGIRDRAARLVEVEHAGAHGTERGAGSDALHYAGEHERRDAVRGCEHEHHHRLHERGDDEHGPTADVVREPSCDEQTRRASASA